MSVSPPKIRRREINPPTITTLDRQRERVEHRASVCDLEFNENIYVLTTTAGYSAQRSRDNPRLMRSTQAGHGPLAHGACG